MIEIMDCLSPLSPIRHVSVMKGVQIGATTCVLENPIAYYIGECPCDILFVSATQDNLKKWALKKLEPLIDSCGLRDNIRHTTDNLKSRKSGDQSLMKEFLGGTLLMASAQAPAALRQDSVRILLRDEVDGAPVLLKTGEGNWLKVSAARTFAFGARAKIVDVSTPTEHQTSNIRWLFEQGDQRKYLVPCPHCGEYQELRWGNEDTKYGVKAETKAGEVIEVYYACQKCEEPIYNSHKTRMLAAGRWEPTAKPATKYHRSYHISALYSPVGMFSWSQAYQEFLDAQENPTVGMRSFVNLVEGLPYKEEGIELNPKDITYGTYKRGTIPDGVLFLTVGVDVQKGSKRNAKKPQRLELEICGHGLGYRTWSIDYKIIIGDVTDPFGGAWQELRQMFLDGKFVFRRADGIEMAPKFTLIDCGWNPADDKATQVGLTEHNTIIKFCESGAQNIFAARGFQRLMRRKKELPDEMAPGDLKGFRWYKSGSSGFWEFSGAWYKSILYDNLRRPRQKIGPQKPGFCDFPAGYPNTYRSQLTSETMLDGGTRFELKTGRTNEALDCRVLNIVAQHIWLTQQIEQHREFFKKEHGLSKDQLAKIDAAYILNGLQSALDARVKEVRKTA
jgi:phage terminase large subunit GpA-like protein